MHPLLKCTDGQEALILAHSKAVARPKQYQDAQPSPYEGLVLMGALGKKTSLRWFEDSDYRAECERFHVTGVESPIYEADCRQVPNASALQEAPRAPVLSGAPAVAEAPEQWRTEAPTVPSAKQAAAKSPFALLRLRPERRKLEPIWIDDGYEADAPQADTRPLLQWVKGCDVPKKERDGLWHYQRASGCIEPASADVSFIVDRDAYLRAAPGVREGDAFSAELYREVK